MGTEHVRSRTVLTWLGGLLLLLAWYGSGQAQEPTDVATKEPEVTTKDVVISATKTPLPISQVTSAVEVIDGKTLEEKKIKTVVDALRLAQGLAVFSQGGPGTQAQVRIRGAEPKHTLVLIDGTIVNDPTSGSFNFANLTAENIERIEILRGAQGMLWGSDAIGGVINIITKRGTGKPTGSAFVEYGSFATIREGAQASGAKGPVDFAFSFSRWDTSNFSAINYRRGAAERDGYHNWQASGKLGVALPKDGRLELSLRWWNADLNLDGFGNNGNPADIFGARQSTNSVILSGSYEQSFTSWWLQKLTLARGYERRSVNDGLLGRDLVTGQTLRGDPDFLCFPNCFFSRPTTFRITNQRLEWQHNFQVAESLLLTAGYQFREEQGNNSNSYGSQQANRLISSHAGFAQAQLNLYDRLFATAGLRQDSYNTFGDATTYRVTAGYLFPTATKIRSSYATGFRAPTLDDLFFQGANNPDLKPEKSRSMDVGIEQRLFKDRLLLSAGYFWNHFRDLIQFKKSPTCPAVTGGTCPINVANSKSQGWEFGFQYAVLDNLDIRGQYTLTLTRSFPATGSNTRLARWPVDQASLGLSYRPFETVRVNVDYRFVGARNDMPGNSPSERLGSFGVVNVSATYDATKNVQVFGRIDNLFNQQYEEVLFFGTPIQSIYAGVKLTY